MPKIFKMIKDASIGVLIQGKPSAVIINYGLADVNVSCKYRSIDGCKCGVGHLIDDDDYQKSFEGTKGSMIARTALTPIAKKYEFDLGDYRGECDFHTTINNIQKIHDAAAEYSIVNGVINNALFMGCYKSSLFDYCDTLGYPTDWIEEDHSKLSGIPEGPLEDILANLGQ